MAMSQRERVVMSPEQTLSHDYIFYGEIIITERKQLWPARSPTDGKHQKTKKIFYKTWGTSKKHQEMEKNHQPSEKNLKC